MEDEGIEPAIGIIRHNVDVEALLEKFLHLRKVAAPDPSALVTNDASNKVIIKLLTSVIDHILFNNQFTTEPNIIAQVMQQTRISEDWMNDFVESKGITKRQRRPYTKFLICWMSILDGIQDLLKKVHVPSIFVGLGKSLQRLSKVYHLSFSNFGKERLMRDLSSLSVDQQHEFSTTLGKLLVRGLLQVNERAQHEFSQPLSHRHDRIFICLEANATDDTLNNTPTLFESFRVEAIDAFNPYPKVSRRRKVRQPKKQRVTKEVQSAPDAVSQAISPTDGSLRCIVVNFEHSEDGNAEDSRASEDRVWILPVRGIKSPACT